MSNTNIYDVICVVVFVVGLYLTAAKMVSVMKNN